MQKKTAIVTGGTSGIGLSLVKVLAKNSYRIYFIGTNKKRGLQIEHELRESNNNAKITFVELDLSNLKELQQFVVNFKQKHSSLELLANIAGVLLPTRHESVDNIEKTFSISYLSHFYLTNELVSLMKKSDSARVVNVAASPSRILKPKIDFNDLNFKNNYNGIKTSTLAVHAKTVFTLSLSQKLSDSKIAVNSFHPGFVKSELFRNMSGFQKFMMKLASLFSSNDSKTCIYVCLSDEIEGVSGKLFVDKNQINLEFDKTYQDRLWKESDAIIKQVL